MADEIKKDLVLNPNQYAFVMDANKGSIETHVGPSKTAMSDNDVPVKFDPRSGEFRPVTNIEATSNFVFADENSYVVLTNPCTSGGKTHPEAGKSSPLPDLDYGRQVVIPGPTRFALWPGQVAEVIPGHQLKSNEYLIARVRNEEEARRNWEDAVFKPSVPAVVEEPAKKAEPAAQRQEGSSEDEHQGPPSPQETSESPDEESPVEESPEAVTTVLGDTQTAENLMLGQLLVIKGTEASFFIPPTGIEVLRDEQSNAYVRKAVTLERLEYCLLLDESGDKRYVTGPAVVFPKPTEQFVATGGDKKFRALELNPDMGIYIKVIADYSDESGEHKAGDELFITGSQQQIYYPREEHSIIRYGDQPVHFAVAIPAGEGRYVLNKRNGEVELVPGPKMFLADPRYQVGVRRRLDLDTVKLYYPGNEEALDYNRKLLGMEQDKDYIYDEGAGSRALYATAMGGYGQLTAQESFGHAPKDEFRRSSTFTPPRTITLDSKYDGAVGISVWTGYAVNVVSKKNTRRVVVGPRSILLGYDEWLEPLELSTGRPKNRDRTIKTVYLRVANNTVSDRVDVITKDLVEVSITVSYRVNFEGDHNKWFDVEDYVGFLTEHLRSMIANEVKNHGIEEFMAGSADIIRDVVLGTKNDRDERSGRKFAENGMRVYDVEILKVEIGDETIEEMLIEAQNDTVRETLDLAAAARKADAVEEREEYARREADAHAETKRRSLEIAAEEARLEAELEQQKEERRATFQIMKDAIAQTALEAELARDSAKFGAKKEEDEHELAQLEGKLQLETNRFQAAIEAEVKRAEAITPELATAITLMGNQMLAVELAKAIGPLAAIHGETVTETFLKLFKDIPANSPLWESLGSTLFGTGNGQSTPAETTPIGAAPITHEKSTTEE